MAHLRGLPPFHRPNLVDAIEAHLRQAHAQGHFSSAIPGERALAAWYGVSRPTLRAALRRLSHDGLLLRKRGRRSRPVPTGA